MRIAIYGGIGAGKSTLSVHLATKYNAVLLPEYVNNDDLQRFLSDMSGQALWFETKLEAERRIGIAETWRQAQMDTVITDFAPPQVFAKMLCIDGIMSQEDYDVFRMVYPIREEIWPDAAIWIATDPEMQLANIARRGRPGESCYTAHYLDALRAQYRRYLRRYCVGGRVLVTINNDGNLESFLENGERVFGDIVGM